MMKRYILVSVIMLLMLLVQTTALFPNEECRKELAAHLKPLWENSDIYWAFEFTGSMGTATGDEYDIVNRNSLFLGLDWAVSKEVSFYIEGGLRHLNNIIETSDEHGEGEISEGSQNRYYWDGGLYDELESKLFFKMKEAFVQYKTGDMTAAAGLRTMTLDDRFLLDERAIGGFFEKQMGNYKFRLLGGSAIKKLTYGDKGWLKAAVFPEEIPVESWRPSNSFGKTNFIGASFSLIPRADKMAIEDFSESFQTTESNDDEWGEDEFANVEENGAGLIEKVGILFNYEFGDEIGMDEYLGFDRIYYGAFADINLLDFAYFSFSAIFQSVDSNNALGYMVRGEKSIDMEDLGELTITGLYMGSETIDGDLSFAPSFTHLSKGEVLSLEPMNSPFYGLELEYSLPFAKPWKLFTAYYSQTSEALDEAEELDVVLTVPIWEGLRSYFIYARVNTARTEEAADYWGLEVRFSF